MSGFDVVRHLGKGSDITNLYSVYMSKGTWRTTDYGCGTRMCSDTTHVVEDSRVSVKKGRVVVVAMPKKANALLHVVRCGILYVSLISDMSYASCPRAIPAPLK